MKSLLLASLLLVPATLRGEDPALDALIRTVLDQSSREDVPFREVVRVVTGHAILPLQRSTTPDEPLLTEVTRAVSRAVAELNDPDHRVHDEERINEVSRHFEEALETLLEAHPDYSCAKPVTESGVTQSAGYPDLRLVHEPSGRVAYLDPKLVHEDSLASSFRTFYYTPRLRTNKILEDAHHLLIGIEHDGNTGAWTFTGWNIVDLHDFQVRLKAEYQASNRDLYRESLILESSP